MLIPRFPPVSLAFRHQDCVKISFTPYTQQNQQLSASVSQVTPFPHNNVSSLTRKSTWRKVWSLLLAKRAPTQSLTCLRWRYMGSTTPRSSQNLKGKEVLEYHHRKYSFVAFCPNILRWLHLEICWEMSIGSKMKPSAPGDEWKIGVMGNVEYCNVFHLTALQSAPANSYTLCHNGRRLKLPFNLATTEDA